MDAPPPLTPAREPARPAPGAAEPVLELEDATITAPNEPGRVLLEHVHWAVRREEFWIVTGLPGSGKSHLLQTAAGLLPPRRGSSRMFGLEPSQLAAHDLVGLRRRAGFVFGEGGRLFHELTVAQNVGLPLCYHGQCGADVVFDRVQSLLALTGLEPLGQAVPTGLSRAWRQRAALARALALEPEVLFLDEATAGLDPRQSHWWLEFLSGLAGGVAGPGSSVRTIVLATDNPRPWAGLGTHYALLEERALRVVQASADATVDALLRELLADAASVS